MPITINGVTCEVITTGYGEHADQSGQGATRGYLCDWDQRFLVANSLLGLVGYTGTGADGTVTRGIPGTLDELPKLWALGVRIEGKGQPIQNTAGLGFTYAIVWADYGMLPYSPGSGGEAQIDPETSFTYATQELDCSEEYIEIPGQVLEGATSGFRLNMNRSFIVHVVDMKITFHRLPYIPMPALAHAGKVNDATFLGIDRGKVKFNGVTVSRDFSSADGSVLQKCMFQFSYRPAAEWNAIPSPNPFAAGTWELMKYHGTSIYPYPYYDLRSVWPGGYVNSA